MKIEKIETKKLEMPYTKPLVTATNNFTVARGLLVTVVTNGGVEGYGYADLFPRAGETPETAQHVIETVLKAKAMGKELEDLARIRADMDHALTGHPRAKSALEGAMYDALARSYHIPLSVMLGGKCRSEIKVIKMVSVGDPEAMAAEAKELVAEGLSLKLKVSGRIDKDLPRVAAVRKAVGDDVFIKIDANEAYDAKTCDPARQGIGRSRRRDIRAAGAARSIRRVVGSKKTFADQDRSGPVLPQFCRRANADQKSHGRLDQHRHSQSRQHRRSAAHRRAVRGQRHPLRAIQYRGQRGR